MELEIVKLIQKSSTPFLDGLFSVITLFGDEIFFICVFLAVYWCYNYNSAFKFAVFYLTSVFVNNLLKLAINRPRPYMASNEIRNVMPSTGLSFPSGHSQSISAIAGYVIYETYKTKLCKKIKTTVLIVFSVLVALVAYSRLYLGQHYLTDVIAGIILGAGVILLLNLIVKKLSPKIKKRVNFEVILAFLSILMLVLLVLLRFYDFGLTYSKLTKVFRYAGMLVGTTVGYILCLRLVEEINISNLIKLIKLTFGYLTTFGVYCLISLISKSNFIIAVASFVAGIIATFVYPLIFNKIYLKTKKV